MSQVENLAKQLNEALILLDEVKDRVIKLEERLNKPEQEDVRPKR